MNEKYTPIPDAVCSDYVQYHHFNSHGMDDSEETEKEFHRMIKQVKAEAWDEGWDAGFADQYGQSTPGGQPVDPLINPYQNEVTHE